MQLYFQLAKWWPLLSPQEDYEEEGLLYSSLILNCLNDWESFLELGCGSGFLASYFPHSLRKVMVDSSAEMLRHCEQANPTAQCELGDMRSLRLGEQFDAVMVHDALMYLTTHEDLLACLQTAADHCRPGGVVLLLPDVVRERFEEGNTLLAGRDTEGASVRLMEWHWDPDREDCTFRVEFSLLVRDKEEVRSHHETHTMGLFDQSTWEAAVKSVGLMLEDVEIPPGLQVGEIFLARKPPVS